MRAHPKSLAAIAVISAISFSASSALALEPSSEAEEMLIGWLEERDCSMSQADFMEKMLAGPGISGPVMMTTRRAMTHSGVIRRTEGNGMALVTGETCGEATVAEPAFDSGSDRDTYVKKLMAVFEENECQLSQEDASRLALDGGMTEEQLDIAGEAIEDSGGFTNTDTGLLLMFGKCREFANEAIANNDPHDTNTVALPDPRENDQMRAQIIEIFEANECSLTEAEAEKNFTARGFKKAEVRQIVVSMVKASQIKVDRESEVARLISGPVCGKTTDD